MNNDLYEFETFVYRIKTLIKEALSASKEAIHPPLREVGAFSPL